MASKGENAFAGLMGWTIFCCILFPLPLGIFAYVMGKRWIWYLWIASMLSVISLFVMVAVQPQEVGSTTRPQTPLEFVVTSVFAILWIAAIVTMFRYKNLFESAGKD